MNFIIDPTTGINHSIFSNNGNSLLKQYINMYQDGGAGKTSEQNQENQDNQEKK